MQMPAITLSRSCLSVLTGCSLLALSPWAEAASWINAQGTLRPQAQQALATLQKSAGEGLHPADYGVTALAQALQQAQGQSLTPEQAASLDQRLNQSVERYLKDLHNGRVDPRVLKENYNDSRSTAVT